MASVVGRRQRWRRATCSAWRLLTPAGLPPTQPGLAPPQRPPRLPQRPRWRRRRRTLCVLGALPRVHRVHGADVHLGGHLGRQRRCKRGRGLARGRGPRCGGMPVYGPRRAGTAAASQLAAPLAHRHPLARAPPHLLPCPRTLETHREGLVACKYVALQREADLAPRGKRRVRARHARVCGGGMRGVGVAGLLGRAQSARRFASAPAVPQLHKCLIPPTAHRCHTPATCASAPPGTSGLDVRREGPVEWQAGQMVATLGMCARVRAAPDAVARCNTWSHRHRAALQRARAPRSLRSHCSTAASARASREVVWAPPLLAAGQRRARPAVCRPLGRCDGGDGGGGRKLGRGRCRQHRQLRCAAGATCHAAHAGAPAIASFAPSSLARFASEREMCEVSVIVAPA